MGFKAKSYAYPYGEFDSNVETIIRKEGFDYICNQNAGAVAPFSTPYSIERIAMGEDTSIKSKLKTRALQVETFNVTVLDNTIEHVEAVLTDKTIKSVEVYITGHTWERVKVNNAKVSYNTKKVLKNERSRVIIKADDKIASKLIMKRKKNGQ